MKKIILLTTLAFAGLTTLFTSCTKIQTDIKEVFEENKVMSSTVMSISDQLINDETFLSYLRSKITEISNSEKNIDLFNDLYSDNEIQENEYDQLAEIIGYDDFNKFNSSFEKQNNELRILVNKYGRENLTEETISDALGKLVAIPMSSQANDCLSIYQNTIISITAQAIVMHIGCAALDVSILLGIACHAGVTTYQISSSNAALAAYNNCLKSSSTQDGFGGYYYQNEIGIASIFPI